MENNTRIRQIDEGLLKEVLEVFKKNYALTTDSRKVEEGSIFVALKGEKYDANTFAKSAIDQGASLVIIDNKDYYIDQRTIVVEDSLRFLQRFATYYRDTFDIPVLAISGTNGKTTTKELIHAVLSTKYRTQATVGNLNNQIGVPLTLLSWRKDLEIGIVEMGASHVGDIDELCRIAKPNMCLLTNIGVAHIEGFGSEENVVKTKCELYRYVESMGGKAFVNKDDRNLYSHSPKVYTSYSLLQEGDVCGKQIDRDSPFASIEVQAERIHSHLVGAYNTYNILAAVSVGLYFGIELETIKEAIENYEPQNNRSQVKKTEHNTLILDCYNANPSSCKSALWSFNDMEAKDKRVFLGEMCELGEVSEKEHKQVAQMVAQMGLRQIIFVGENYKPYSTLSNCLWFETSEEARDFLQTQKIEDSLILIKGSRKTQMEKLGDVL
jgi:UDP-N-acetylmuramoyl-tripeptide--D-alanyl-D-alanine ligase